jgi:hypothetical protein
MFYSYLLSGCFISWRYNLVLNCWFRCVFRFPVFVALLHPGVVRLVVLLGMN